MAREHARSHGRSALGTEHLLLGLPDVGISYNPTRTEIVDRLNAVGVLSRYHNPR
ncbi:Clp protease N-terminal domain-containing protein [Nonomuraea sp. NPDC050783]|uniref:Clp protease N-terminal domain-containing protein n=1 Tax=Nonomuraea sp. NPDC050783 TaxID=3154634 RepID=UPI003465BE3E